MNSVVADSVNPISISRQSWRDCAQGSDCHVIEIELICSDETEHKDRIEKRKADIKGHKMPDWQNVLDREYEDWKSPHIKIDTAAKTSYEIKNITVHEIEKHF
ncbi:hypothetical protein NBRC116602_20620 [Hyphomicrobiales bacterium 4NK60-0047b]